MIAGVLPELFPEAFDHRQAVKRQCDVDLGRELVAHPARAASRCAGTEMGFFFEEDNILRPAFCEVIGGAGAHHAAADDEDVCCLGEVFHIGLAAILSAFIHCQKTGWSDPVKLALSCCFIGQYNTWQSGFSIRSSPLKNIRIQRFLPFLSLLVVFTSLYTPVFAQEAVSTERRTFADFRNEVISLHGPADAQSVKFNLPAHWRLAGDVIIQLDTTTFLPNSLAGFQGTVAMIRVQVNGEIVDEAPISSNGDAGIELTIPFADIQADDLFNIDFLLESYIPVKSGQEDAAVYIHPSSIFQFTYDAILPATDLVQFPRQLIQDSLEPDRALLVIPDQPTAVELQSALTVAAGLIRLSQNQLNLEVYSVSQVTPELQAGSHLILVGKPEPFLALQGLIFPSPIVVRSDPQWTVQFLLPDRYEFERTAPDDGIIQLVNSPWNAERLVLLVSGETDQGVIKAARAVSSGKLRKNVFPNLAIVKETRINSSASQPDLEPDSSIEDTVPALTLSDYTAPFTSDPSLGTTAFVLPRDDIPAWQAAIHLAGQLGAAVDGDAINLSAYFGDELQADTWSGSNILVVGRASAFPFLFDLGDVLPVPFEKGKDIPADTGLDIHYRISKDYDSAGYLEILPSPQNKARVILTVLGNDAKGIEWAASALLTPSLRDRLTGNFALINESQVFVRDSHSERAVQSTLPPEVAQVEPLITPPPVKDNLLLWQAGVLFLVLIVIAQFFLHKRGTK